MVKSNSTIKINMTQNILTDYIDVRHNELIEEKLRVNAAIKAKKRRQDELAQAFIDLGKDAPKEAKQMVNDQLEECRNDITTLQVERDEVDAKFFDPDQVREILDELTNQLDSIGEKNEICRFLAKRPVGSKYAYGPRNQQ